MTYRGHVKNGECARLLQVGRRGGTTPAGVRACQAAAGVAGEVWGAKRFFHSRGMSSCMRSAG